MLLLAGGVVFGILRFKERLERTYVRYVDKDISVAGAMGDLEGTFAKVAPPTLLRAARPGLERAIQSSRSLNDECKPFTIEMQRLDLLQLDKERFTPTYQMIPDRPELCKFADPSLNAAYNQMARACKSEVVDSESISGGCATALFILRSMLTRQTFGVTPLSAIRDMRILTDMMFAEFALLNNPDGTPVMPNLSRAKQIADRMQEISPNFYVAAKVNVLAEVIEGLNMRERIPRLQPEYWKAAEVALERAQHLNPNDRSLDEAEMLIRTHGFVPTEALEYTKKQIAAKASNGKAWFYKAYAEWKLAKYNDSIASLRQAVALEPRMTDWARTLEAVTKPHAQPDAFKGSISFGVTSQDFEH